MPFLSSFTNLELSRLSQEAAERKRDGWRFVQLLAVRVDKGNDLIYSFMKDGILDNLVIRDVAHETEIPSITDHYLSAFVFENEAHDLFGANIVGIAIDFAGNFYRTSIREPMSVISPEQLAAREKAAKIAAAQATKAAKSAKSVKIAGEAQSLSVDSSITSREKGGEKA